jgi:hypothetical protein
MTVMRYSPMPIRLCAACGQPLRTQRGGVFMSPLKAAIWDAIVVAGDVGLSTADLMRLPVWHRRKRVKPVTVRMHVLQINDVLAASPWRIVSIDRRYVIVKLGGDQREAAE